MIYLASIYIENIPKKVWWNKIFKPIIIHHKLTTNLIEAENREDGMVKVYKIIEEYKDSNPEFYSDKKFTPFLEEPK